MLNTRKRDGYQKVVGFIFAFVLALGAAAVSASGQTQEGGPAPDRDGDAGVGLSAPRHCHQRALRQMDLGALAQMRFPAGSMGPKVEAARSFVATTGRRAVIGSLDHIEAMVQGRAGTEVVAAARSERSA